MIKLASWNIRGMNAPYKFREVRKAIVDYNLHLLCIVESKVNKRNIDAIKLRAIPQWEFVHNCGTNNVARVWVTWDPVVFDVVCLKRSVQTITCKVSIRGTQICFMVTGVYGFNDRAPRYRL